jgi:hypothetical protein
MKCKSLIISLLLLLTFASTSLAATYYMRADGKAANKTASTGPPSDPTKCMSVATHNIQKFSPGDTLYLSSQGGNYTIKLNVPSNGSKDNYITYTNVNGETPVFKLETALSNTGWINLGDGRFTKSTSSLSCLFQNGIPLSRASTTALMDGNFIHSSGTTYYKPPTGHNPSEYKLTYLDSSSVASVNTCFVLSHRSYVKIKKNTSGTINCENSKVGILIYTTSTSSNSIIVDGLYFKYCYDAFFAETNSNGFYTTGEFKNNKAYRCNSFFRAYADWGGAFTSYHTWTLENNYGDGIGSINGSTCWGNYDQEYCGIQNATKCIIRDNIAVNGKCIFCFLYTNPNYESYNNLIYRNFIWKNGEMVFRTDGTQPWSISNTKYYDNISYNYFPSYVGDSNRWQILIMPGDNNDTMNYCYNNTVIGGEIGIALHWDGSPGAIYWTFKNNIIDNIISGGANVNIRTNHTNYIFDNNCYDTSVNFVYNASSKTFTQWKTNTGQDVHSVQTTPQLINSGGASPADYKLQTSSQCIQAGTNVGLTTDYLGNKWLSPPSKGSIEYYSIDGVISPRTIGGSN